MILFSLVVGVLLQINLSLAGSCEDVFFAKPVSAIVSEQAHEAPQIRKSVFFKDSNLPFDALAFDKMGPGEFRPALTRALRMAKARFGALRASTEVPTFANTIGALEAVMEPLDRVTQVFFSYSSLNKNPALEAVSDKMLPKLTAFENSIYFDSEIFKKVEALYQQSDKLGLDLEQKMQLETVYTTFIRNGAKLDKVQKARLGAIDSKIALLGEKFGNNTVKAINAFELVVTDASQLAGIPEDFIQDAAKKAESKGKKGSWIFTLQSSTYVAVMTYAEDPQLRKQMWQANGARATSGEFDNRPVLLQIAKLRAERAKLLGYATHAAFVTEERMAQTPEAVTHFLGELVSVYKPAAIKDLNELREFAGVELNPWDISFYSERLKSKLYGFNEEELRPYFPLNQVVEGAFFAANKRYGVTFHERKDLPSWNSDVIVYEVRDRDGQFLALYYLDPFSNKSKRAGAWNNTFQDAGMFAGQMRRPFVLNAMNVKAPEKGSPALLSLNDVTTLFHELGHGLHAMLTRVRTRSLSGTNVSWDFVELPSQMNENWATEPEVLAVYAKHYQTGAPLPVELVEKVKRAENFQAGYIGLRQIRLGMLDMAWHNTNVDQVNTVEDVEAFERAATAPFRLIESESSALSSPSFAHIFSGGYSAGYYSYKWADVLAADAFAVFKEKGVFSPDVSGRFLHEILEKGGSEEPMVLYRRFKGGDPDPKALLRKEGLIP